MKKLIIVCFSASALAVDPSDLNGKNYDSKKNSSPDLISTLGGPQIKVHGVIVQKLSKNPVIGSPARFLVLELRDSKNNVVYKSQSDNAGNFEINLDKSEYKKSRNIIFIHQDKIIKQIELPRTNDKDIDMKEIYIEYKN